MKGLPMLVSCQILLSGRWDGGEPRRSLRLTLNLVSLDGVLLRFISPIPFAKSFGKQWLAMAQSV